MDIWHRVLLFLACIALAHGKLRILDLKVPSTIENGVEDVVILDCDFEASKDEDGLEVKWFYGEDEQIYQWIPKRSKPQALGSFKDRIDLSYKASSDPTTMYRALRIKDVTPELSGDYKCKITSFVNEDTATKKMIIYEPAKEFEFIHMDEDDKVICTANGVYPEPELTITMIGRNGTTNIDEERDTDGDGIPDHEDDDDDNDGIPDTKDSDDDNDGIPDAQDDDKDSDGDGIPDHKDDDDDNDGIPDSKDEDDDNDGIPDVKDTDHPTNLEMKDKPATDGDDDDDDEKDTDGDGTPDHLDDDDDNDGIPDTEDDDDDGDGIPDAEENDADDADDDDDDDDDEFIKIQNDDKTFNLTRVLGYKESEMSGDTKIVCELHIPGTTYRLKKSVHVYTGIISTTTETQIQSEFDNDLPTIPTETDDADDDDDDNHGDSEEDNGSWQQLPSITMLLATFLLVLMDVY